MLVAGVAYVCCRGNIASCCWREEESDRFFNFELPSLRRNHQKNVRRARSVVIRNICGCCWTLLCRRDASVHTLIVVDRPDAATLPEVRSLASYMPNRVVRVSVLPENSGAAMARNSGMGQSFGDYCVLLDDDVVPEPGLLDAYLGRGLGCILILRSFWHVSMISIVGY